MRGISTALKSIEKDLEDDASLLNRLSFLARAGPAELAAQSRWLAAGRVMRPVNFMVKPNGRLVLVSCRPCGPFTSSLSNRWSSCALLAPYGLGDLILGSASRLYAFSVYHNRTSLPSRAIGMTAGTQEVRSSRSSRTKDKPPQISCAHIR